MNIKTYISGLLLVLLSTVNLSAQKIKASDVVKNTIGVFQNNAVQTKFGLVVKEKASSQLQKMVGTFVMQGDKFTLKTDELQVYFDGKTQWAYMPMVNEVTISEPSEEELAQTNPLILIQTYSAKSTAKFIRNDRKQEAYTVELTPKEKNGDINKIQIIVNKSTYHPQSIQLTDKNGIISSLALIQFKTGIRTDTNTFVFNRSIYKDIEINDLR